MSKRLPTYDELTDAVARALVEFTKPKFQDLARRVEALEGRQARKGGPLPSVLPAERPRVRVPGISRPYP